MQHKNPANASYDGFWRSDLNAFDNTQLLLQGVAHAAVGVELRATTAVSSYEFGQLGWDYDMIERAAAACNASNKVRFLRTVTPTLILVPATRGRGDNEKITYAYLTALHELRPKSLHFTHYGFLQGRFPAAEVSWVLHRLLGQQLPTSLQMITVDIVERQSHAFYKQMCPSLPEPDVDPWA